MKLISDLGGRDNSGGHFIRHLKAHKNKFELATAEDPFCFAFERVFFAMNKIRRTGKTRLPIQTLNRFLLPKLISISTI